VLVILIYLLLPYIWNRSVRLVSVSTPSLDEFLGGLFRGIYLVFTVSIFLSLVGIFIFNLVVLVRSFFKVGVYSLYLFFVVILAIVSVFLAKYTSFYKYFWEDLHLGKLLRFLGIMLLVILLLNVTIYLASDVSYTSALEKFKSNIEDSISVSDLDAAWFLARIYYDEFEFTYRKIIFKPRQVIIALPNLIFNLELASKIAVISKTGACFDFAVGVTKLMEDVYGYEARVISFVGYDHAVPEVKINGTWYVIDISFTTRSGPIKADDYASYLKSRYPKIYNSITGMIDIRNAKM